MNATETDRFILSVLKTEGPKTCPELAVLYIDRYDSPHNDMKYQHYRNLMQRHMKSLEKYGFVMWDGTVCDVNGSKLWRPII